MSLRTQIRVELLSIAALTAVYLVAFPDRPRYLDGLLGVLAVALIGLGYRRTLRLWRAHPPVPLPYARRLRSAAAWAALFTGPAAAVLLAAGIALGHAQGGWPGAAERVLNWHIVPAIALYVIWGLVQQFVFEFYLLGRLTYLMPAPAAIGVTALIFSAVHFPRVIVMLAVAVAAVVWAVLYRRYRTLLPLALSHAILGAALHYWIFGRDLLAQWLLR